MQHEDNSSSPQKKPTSKKEAKLKAASYCAYQERSQHEVRNKLFDLGLHSDEVDEVLSELIIDGFVNEERFSKAYVGGKFRVKKWGRVKILHGLKQHKISEYCVNKGLQEIDEEEYLETLRTLLTKKAALISFKSNLERNSKLGQFAITRGFEPSYVWGILKTEFL